MIMTNRHNFGEHEPMHIIAHALHRLSTLMRWGACLCVLGMAVITGTDVLGRLGKHPVFGSEEIAAFLAVLALGLSLPYAHEHRSHIGVEIFVQLLRTRTRRWLKLLREILSIAFFSIVTWMMAKYAHDKQISGEVSMNLHLPEHFFIYVLAGCFAVTTLCMVVDTVRFICEWRRM